MNQVVVSKKELESFLDYLEDKVDPVYQNEVKQAIERFKNEQVSDLGGANIIKGN
jgi:hypothetical protein